MKINSSRSIINCAMMSLWAIVFFAIFSWANAATITYFHNDVSGSPLMATDANGNILWKESYKAYGSKLNNQAASTSNKIGFHGKPYDNNSGLSYIGARYYDPLIGRFMGMDPQPVTPENLHSFNRYAYANNNPYKFVDPDGHSPVDVVFLLYDVGKLSVALYTGVGVGPALFDVGASTVGVLSPFVGTGQVIKSARAVEHGVEAARTAKETFAEIRRLGKAGEDITRGTKEGIIGEQISIITSEGKRTVTDFVRKTEGKLTVTETKVGQSKLSPGQNSLKEDVKAGRQVTPVGENARAAGLEPGKKIKVDEFEVDRIDRSRLK